MLLFYVNIGYLFLFLFCNEWIVYGFWLCEVFDVLFDMVRIFKMF